MYVGVYSNNRMVKNCIKHKILLMEILGGFRNSIHVVALSGPQRNVYIEYHKTICGSE